MALALMAVTRRSTAKRSRPNPVDDQDVLGICATRSDPS